MSSWSVSIAYRTKDGREGVQTFIVQAHSALGAVRRAWAEARTLTAMERRKSASLVVRPRSLRATKLSA